MQLERPRETPELEARLRRLFPPAGPGTISSLSRTASVGAYPTGAPITQGPGLGPPLVLVVEGIVARLAHGADGGEFAYGLLRSGETGGIDALAIASHPDLGLTAWSDCVVARWSAGEVRDIAALDAPFALALLDVGLSLSSALARALDEMHSIDAVHRLARVLTRHPDLFFAATRPVLGRGNLATLMGTSREMMERCLRQLEQGDVVRRNATGGLKLLDPVALGELAG
jgi:CRP-like cAMP-binding protein